MRTFDDLANETSPGVQTRRYRLLSVGPMVPGKFGHTAIVQVVNCEPGLVPIKEIDANFLPISPREVFYYMEDEAGRAEDRIRLEKAGIGLPSEEIEYEITVRRVEPTPGFVSLAVESARTAP